MCLAAACVAAPLALRAEPVSRVEAVKGTATPGQVSVPSSGEFLLSAGRSAGDGIVFQEGTVSRHHATLRCVRRECRVEDTGNDGKGSLNGTFVNGVRLVPGMPVPLRPDDRIDLGPDASLRVK